jgi:hypothetical protein
MNDTRAKIHRWEHAPGKNTTKAAQTRRLCKARLTSKVEDTSIRLSARATATQTTMANPEQSDFQPTDAAAREHADGQAELLARLEQAVAAIHDSESFRRYLDVQARFHHYSFGNTLLILSQRPDATNVAGFKAWRKLNRFVKKGEKGIAIVVPHVRKTSEEESKDGEEARITGFGRGFVFDVSQTDGESLPTVDVPMLEGEEGQDLYDRLTGLVATEGLALERRPAEAMSPDVMGFYTPAERRIVVREASPLQMVKTLAHELGHHFTGLTDASRSEHETVAESVAYIVCAHHGLDSATR